MMINDILNPNGIDVQQPSDNNGLDDTKQENSEDYFLTETEDNTTPIMGNRPTGNYTQIGSFLLNTLL